MEVQKSITDWIKFFLEEFFPSITKDESDMIGSVLHWEDEKRVAFHLAKRMFDEDINMDKQIRKIEKESKRVGKDLKKLEKEDKKRDKACDMGERMMKKKK